MTPAAPHSQERGFPLEWLRLSRANHPGAVFRSGREPLFTTVGRLGVWTKADSQTLFDDLVARPLGSGSREAGALMMERGRRILISLLLAVNAAASAQQTRPQPVTWFLSLSAVPQAGAGLVGVAELRARIDAGWHLYSMTQPPGGPRATRIEIPSDSPFRLAGPIQRPAPDTIPDANFGIMSEVHDDSVTFRLPLASGPGPRRGTNRLVVAVTWQACTSRLCLLPRTDSVTVTVRRTR